MKAPAISVVIPVYNTPESDFRRCIGCLKGQTFPDFEGIVVDDGSTDTTAAYVDEACADDERLTVIHTRNRGVSHARNTGIDRASGEALCFIDADDFFAPWMLEDLWNAYKSSDSVDAVCAHFAIVKQHEFDFVRNSDNFQPISTADMQKVAITGTVIKGQGNSFLSAGPCALLTRKSDDAEVFFPVDIHYMEDTIRNIRYFRSSRLVIHLNETVYAYRMNPYSATHRFDPSVIPNRLMALKVLQTEVPEKTNEWFALRALANYYLCCKCIMWSADKKPLIRRLGEARELANDSIWDSFKRRDIASNWPRKEKLKRWAALLGIVPLIIAIKGVRNE